MNEKHKQAFRQAGENMKSTMNALGCTTAVTLLERDGACAVIVDGKVEAMDSRRFRATLELFIERLREIGQHADDDGFDTEASNECFIHNSKTGKFDPAPDFFGSEWR